MGPISTMLMTALAGAVRGLASGAIETTGGDLAQLVRQKLHGWFRLEARQQMAAFDTAVQEAVELFRKTTAGDATATIALTLLTEESPEARAFRQVAMEELVLRSQPNRGRLLDTYRREVRWNALLRGQELPQWIQIQPYIEHLLGVLLPQALRNQPDLRPLLLEQAELQALDAARTTAQATRDSAATLLRIETLLQDLIDLPTIRQHKVADRDITDSPQIRVYGNDYTVPIEGPQNIQELYQRYKAFVEIQFGELDFRGIVQMKTMMRVKLDEVYVPLRGQTTGRLLHAFTEPEQQRLTMKPDAAKHRLATYDDEALTAVNQSMVMVLETLVRDHPFLVVLGDPGTGKSTLVRSLMLSLVQGHAQSKVGLSDEWLPILFPVAAFAEAHRDSGRRDLPPLDYLPEFLQGKAQPDYLPLFKRALLAGRALVIFDGLDEVREKGERLALVKDLESFVREWEVFGNRFVATSRIAGYNDAPLDDRLFAQTIVQPFHDDDIRLFAWQWSRAYEKAGTLPDDPQLAEQELQRLTEERAKPLELAIFGSSGITELARNPLLLTILALIHNQGTRLPDRRVDLYRLCVEALAETWNHARSLSNRPINHYLGDEKIDERFVVNLLGPAALWIHSENPGGLVEQRDLIQQLTKTLAETFAFAPGKAQNLAADFVELVYRHTGLLQERGHQLYGFLHLTFEEYLAARALLESVAIADPDTLIHRYASQAGWREVMRLMVASTTLRDTERLLLHLLKTPTTTETSGRPVVLAGECLLDLGRKGTTQKARNAVINALIATIEDVAIPRGTRVDAGTTLGEIGDDPRLLNPMTGTSADERYWCEIEAGSFWYGDDLGEDNESDKDEETEEDEHETPSAKEWEKKRIARLKQMHLDSAFQIGRYLVTNAEFAHFIADNGYDLDKSWWTAEGRKYISPEGTRFYEKEMQGKAITLPRFWHNSTYNTPIQPIVGVSWYEAAAYCIWLTQQGHEQGWLPKEEVVRLPTSLEWERAARHTDNRPYPWGDASPTPEHANYKATGIDRPSSVGCFPMGAAICGAQDMAGNVDEWLATPDTNREQVEPEQDFGLQTYVLIYRGSFGGSSKQLLCGSQDRSYPNDRYSDGGFRLVRSLAPAIAESSIAENPKRGRAEAKS